MTRESLPAALKRGPIAWMARNSVAANLAMAIVLMVGLFGVFKTKQEVFPEFSLDTILVQVPYPGASPEETEQGIVLAIEEAVRGLDGVKRVTSTASEGMGAVTVELLLGANGDKVLADVKNAVDRIISFPENAEKPIVSLLARKSRVISLILSGDRDLRELHRVAEMARSDLLAIKAEDRKSGILEKIVTLISGTEGKGITQVEIEGVPPLEVSIEIPRDTLEAYGLTLEQVAREVRAASIELPGGSVKTKGGEVLVRVADRRKSGYEFGDIILRSSLDGSRIRLGDIATIKDGFEETDQASYYNGQRAVRVTAYRIGKETPDSVSSLTRAYAEELARKLPKGITVALWDDDSEKLESRMNLLFKNAILGFVLVFLLLAMFLNIRLAVWVSLGIPISFMGAFAVMPTTDVSVNMITLFAFIVTLGMVVDDAIVVGENIFQKMQEGTPKLRAAVVGCKEMAVPITFSILTTMVAFAPLLFVPGIMGKIFRFIPIIVILVLGFSLVESFFILPAHLSHSKGAEKKARPGLLDRFQGLVARLLGLFTEKLYFPVLKIHIRLRYIVVAVALATLAVSAGLVAGGFVPFRFFPSLEGDVVNVTAELPYGTPVERTIRVQKILEAAADRALASFGGKRHLRGMYAGVGTGPRQRGPRAALGAPSGSHLVTIEMNLVPSDQRGFSAEQMRAAWEKETPPLPGMKSLVFSSTLGPSAGAAIDVQLSHDDIAVLETAAADLTEQLRGFSELTDIKNGFSEGKPQLDFTLLPEARTLGLSSAEVAGQIRSAFYGREAIREQRGRNELKIMVRYPKSERRSEYNIEKMLIRTPAGGQVPLMHVAEAKRNRAPTVIAREEGRRTVNVTAELLPGVPSSANVIQTLGAGIMPELLGRYPGLKWEMGGEQREQKESFKALGLNFVIALFIMFTLIAIPFKSYVQPLIIMSAIPFGIVGAVTGHLVMGYHLSIMSVFGIVALSGVVVNDSIVLIDATNRARADGMTAMEAITWAGRRRLRPILLTSLTTFLGLMPIITETSVQAQFLIPMAISLGFGVLFGTFIILLLVPSLYIILEDVKGLFRRG